MINETVSDNLLSRRGVLLGAGALGATAIASSAAACATPLPAEPPGDDTTVMAVGTRATAEPLAGPADPNGRFRGKTLIVTGATSGFGRAVAEEAAKQGAFVSFIGRRANLGREVQAGIRDIGGDAEYNQLDVLDRQALKRWIDDVAARRDGIDLAFINAGIAQRSAPVAELADEHWDEMWRTNVSGMFFATKDVVPHMLARGGGAIVYTGSAFGHRGQPTLAAYNANKYAVHGLMRSVALELGPQNIRVNAVAPGAVPTTDFGRNNPPMTAEGRAQGEANHGIARMGITMEIAKPVLWLMTEEASFMQGAVVAVDGAFRVG